MLEIWLLSRCFWYFLAFLQLPRCMENINSDENLHLWRWALWDELYVATVFHLVVLNQGLRRSNGLRHYVTTLLIEKKAMSKITRVDQVQNIPWAIKTVLLFGEVFCCPASHRGPNNHLSLVKHLITTYHLVVLPKSREFMRSTLDSSPPVMSSHVTSCRRTASSVQFTTAVVFSLPPPSCQCAAEQPFCPCVATTFHPQT